MKKNLLLMMLCCPAMLAAQNGVTVSNLAVDAGTVTFNVQWTNNHAPDFVWSDTVWVFVDYNNNGVMERLPVTGATATAGTVTKIPNNDKGAWVAGNARTQGSFSATVKLLTAVKDIGGACVYGSNYPPVGKYTAADKIEFTGTPPYNIVLKNNGGGTETHTESSPYTVPPSYTVQSFTDKTGAPGRFNCISPAAYTLSGSDVCMGTDITLTLSGSESGWHYQLYKNNIPVGSEKEGTGSPLTFSEVSSAVGGFSYMVQTVDASGTQCEIQVSNVLAITVNPVPSIRRSGGAAIQSVNQNTAITTIIYTASNATSISRSGTTFPSGLDGSTSGLVHTISGNPNALGIFGYTVTASNTNGCPSASASGTITVCGITTSPPGAASTQTWCIGTQTWSAALRRAQPGCTSATTWSGTNPPTVAYYRSDDLYLTGGYYYNWKCMNNYAAQLCPSPWRVPTYADAAALDLALGGTGANRSDAEESWIHNQYIESWGGVLAGWFSGSSVLHGQRASYWLSDDIWSETYGSNFRFDRLENVYPRSNQQKHFGLQIRCVK
jgi:uncharacterized protein (TIGR02145 family)